MERLTGRSLRFAGSNTVLYELEAVGNKNCIDLCSETHCGECEVQKAINRLAAYEDSGLEPAEIAAGNERIKQIILERFKERKTTFEEIPDGFDRINLAAAMDELTEIYSRIFGVSYDEAAVELRSKS